METRSLDYVCSACGGELVSAARMEVQGVCTDSRAVQPGNLFFALRGDKFDGHEFLAEVAGKGAAAVVVEREKLPPGDLGCAVLWVDDTRKALGRLAARYRRDYELPVIVVGGSNGKTSCKELIAAMLRQKLKTLWSEASFNNDIGVPLTLLKLERTHQAAVLEAGTNHPGDLEPLLKMIKPRFGVITSIGREHLEFFGDTEGVVNEEGTILEYVPDSGRMFLNGDDEWTPVLERRAKAPVTRVGLAPCNEWRAEDLAMNRTGIDFKVISRSKPIYSGDYSIGMLGRHQAVNALFAIALGAELGLQPGDIREGLASCRSAKMRMEVFEAGGITILDDTYNANADSMRAALQTLHDYPAQGRRIAVLGTMAELGEHSSDAHEEAGRCAALYGAAHLVAVGPWGEMMVKGAREAGMENATQVADVPTAVKELQTLLEGGDVLLVKGSRAARMERIREALVA